ncbi:MAG: hypothetical protein RI947_349 [Candidatus Parcubacteria bacterium]|jgi:large subunit ribosomal protein L18
MANTKNARLMRRKKRVSSNIVGTAERPRIAVHRSNKYIYAQAIDDVSQKTIASYSSFQLIKTEKKELKKSEEAKIVGERIAKALKEKKVSAGVFDRGRFTYNGRVKALAEGLREGGLTI